ncbi:MAG: DUF502 domain-containing protein [Burkholderiales bacterium]
MRKYFVTGLLILVPLVITVWVISLIVGTLDQSLLLLPARWRPEALVGFHIPLLGTIFTLLIIFFTGLAARNFIGNQIVRGWEWALTRIPGVNAIYSSVKQVSDTLLSSSGNAFRTAVLVEYPRQGCWTIAFVTGLPGGDVKNHLQGDYISIYVPTTPNPTSGFFLMVPRESVIELDMSVDAALKYIVSMGVVAPEPVGKKPNPALQKSGEELETGN